MSHFRHFLNVLLATLALLVLIGLVSVLYMVLRNYEKDIQDVTMTATEAFQRSGVIKNPKDRKVSIADVADLVATFEANPRISRIYVSKSITISKEPDTVLLHPFYFSTQHPDWRQRLSHLPTETVRGPGGEGDAVGKLYFDVDYGPLRAVRVSIFIASLAIFILLAVLLVRIFSQQKVLDFTTQVLEDNRRELIRMERLSLAGLLTANIFHDIRKPITNIKHELGDLSEALGGFAGASRAMRNMRDQVALFFDILHDLNLERFVRADDSDEEYVDVNRVVEQSLRLVQYERGATTVNIQLGSNLPLLLLHPYRLVQVLSNLILNAYQALEGQGELRIVTYTADAQGKHDESDAPSHVVVEINDNGPGIDPEHLQEIFSPFFSTKAKDKGTGLGLYICKQIVDDLNGQVRVRSQSGKGTAFRVILPAAE